MRPHRGECVVAPARDSRPEGWARRIVALKGNALQGSAGPSPGFSLGITGLALSLLLPLRSLPAQAIGQGVELERAGQYDRAASLYFATLRADPTNLAALLGLERVLPPLNRLGEVASAAQPQLWARAPSAASAPGSGGARRGGGRALSRRRRRGFPLPRAACRKRPRCNASAGRGSSRAAIRPPSRAGSRANCC